MRFAYRVYGGGDPSPDAPSETWLRPALKVRVSGTRPASHLSLWGILDTGAEDCVLPLDIADLVVPAWGSVGALAGFTGDEHLVRYGAVQLQIRLGNQVVRWTASVAFDPEREGEALWGMAGFLEHFQVTFDGPGKHFTIRLRGEPPPGFTVATVAERRGWRPRSKSTPIEPHEQDP